MRISDGFQALLRARALPALALLVLAPVGAVAGCDNGGTDDLCGPCGCGDVPADGCCGGGDGCCGAEDGCCGEFGGGCPPGSQPVVYSDVRPHPLSGGTLLVTKGGYTAIVSDPDRDRVLVVDLTAGAITQQIATPQDAEPGRAVEDAAGIVHVVLRQGGGILSFDPAGGAPVQTHVCSDPRGIAYVAASDKLLVACAGGELARLTATAAPVLEQTTVLERDLRDVVISNGKIFVSHFRSAKLDVVDASGIPVKTSLARGYTGINQDTTGAFPTFTPTVAWRTIPRAAGGVFMIHQEAKSSVVMTPDEGGGTYGGFDCNSGIAHSQVTTFDDNGDPDLPVGMGGLASMPLPVDITESRDGSRIAMLAAGNGTILETTPDGLAQHDGCGENFPQNGGAVSLDARTDFGSVEPVALAYDGDDDLVVQLREPAALEIHGNLSGAVARRIDLGGATRADTGYLMFHSDADTMAPQITCATCHPEGTEDGHVWHFQQDGARRTQSLAGDIRSTAPFHWRGDLVDVSAVMAEVFVKRMGGFSQTPERITAIESYIGTLPAAARPATIDTQAVARGKQLFESTETQCLNCHSGDKLTNNSSVDVGTGGPLQVPSLIGVGARAPYMHDGCAPTLMDRFGACGGGDLHGHTSQLTSAQLSDLVSYLDSL